MFNLMNTKNKPELLTHNRHHIVHLFTLFFMCHILFTPIPQLHCSNNKADISPFSSSDKTNIKPSTGFSGVSLSLVR